MATILVIDDDAALRRVLKRMIGADHEVVEAADGAAGIARFAEHKPRLVITDILMPKKEGIETIREIRRLAPGVKILAISGGAGIGTPHYLDMAAKLGADVTLMKPFSAAALRSAVSALLADTQPVGTCAP
jgi:two-component system, chemotaxis family, chemotaxis protein CheY